MTSSDSSPKPELDQVLAQVMALHGEETGARIDRLIQQYPAYAAEITECWQMHSALQATRVRSQASLQTSDVLKPFVGSVLGGYEILDELDRGGMGVVYRARNPALERVVALKVIRSGELADVAEIIRFRREAQATARLLHPGIIPIYEVGQERNLLYYTMPLIEGETLAVRAARERLSPREAVAVVHRLTMAMEYAHARGIIHRDLKPSNVLIDAKNHPIIIDFGLATIAHLDSDLTGSSVIGTPAYMAPEQLHGGFREAMGLREGGGPSGDIGLSEGGRLRDRESISDVYSLGAILYFLLSGRPPFMGPTTFDVLLQVKDREPLAPSRWNRAVDHELDAICSLAMEKNPLHRYATASAFGHDLQLWLDGIPIDLPVRSWTMRWNVWWRKTPSLLSHWVALLAVMAIVSIAHAIDVSRSNYVTQMGLLLAWFGLCLPLQRWWSGERDGWFSASTWALVDVLFTTSLIANAETPRSLLLIAYPMMIAASALFYRTRLVIGMTIACVFGFAFLAGWTDDPSMDRTDFQAIFVIGLGVLGLTLSSMIGRIRNVFSLRRF